MRKCNWRRGMAITLSLLCLAGSLSGCAGTQAAGSGTQAQDPALRVGVRSLILGFGYLNQQTGKYSGMEVDLAQELAKRLGYADVTYTGVTPETREEALLGGDVDCVIACYSIDEDLFDRFDFSPAYYEDASVIMVEDSSLFDNIEDLGGCTFGTVAGSNTAYQLAGRLQEIGFSSGEPLSVSEDQSEIVFDNFRVTPLGTYQQLDEALEEGLIDAMCADGCIARTYLVSDRHLLDFQISTQDYGVATLKGSPLSGPIAETIQAMLDDGTVAALIDKWD